MRFPFLNSHRCRTACLVITMGVLPAFAGAGEWSLRLEGVFTDLYGHDQHVLTVHESDSVLGNQSRVAGALDTDSGFAYRSELRYQMEDWGFGLDFNWFKTNQSGPDQRRSGSSEHPVVFEIADRSYRSDMADTTLYYAVLEDTAVATWTVDLFAIRTLAQHSDSRLELLFGLRNADFDNDYRAVVGIADEGGTRVDASSNYGRLMGPMLGLHAELRFGRQRVEGKLGQSVVFGEVELSGLTRDYTGTEADYSVEVEVVPAFDTTESTRLMQDVAIPISELQVFWIYDLSSMFSLGLGAHSSVWWDVPVPPGVIPGPGGNTVLHENTLVYFGLALALEMHF